jgi:2-hydroxy-6-oxonona-2,4-dienedioate hydrolase
VVHAEKFVDVDGIRTRYLEAGTGDPMVLVHGGNFGMYCLAEDWAPVIDRLATGFRVLAVDKLGCGFTDNPASEGDYLIGSMVDHVYEFLSVLGIDRAHLVGHSRGGYAVTRLAIEHPELVKSLTIVDSSSLVTAPNPLYLQWDEEAAQLSDPRERVRYLVTVNSYSPDHVDDHFVDMMARVIQLPKTQAAAKVQAEHRARFNEDLVERQKETHEWISSGRISWPTLVMWGFNDPSATMERCGVPCMNLILSNVAASEMHILNRAGHYCYREQPQAFAETVMAFIERHR